MRLHIWLVTGARKRPPGSAPGAATNTVQRVLLEAYELLPDDASVILMHGDAPGVDNIADNWCDDFPIERMFSRPFPAPWDVFRALGLLDAAGPVRNEEMLQAALTYGRIMGAQLRCFAFPSDKSRGNWDMVRRCEREFVEVLVTKL